MDKYENKVKIDEIKSLISQGAYEEAADIADTINWATVKNIPALGMASDLYKKLRLFEESRNILFHAYNRQKSKPVVKSLCELSIQLGDLMNAISFLQEFKEMAPNDPSVYILQYKLYKAQNISIEEQIEVLEALKIVENMPKWSYELATLYHKAGMVSQCIKECDDIILWFVDGKYVISAYELKSQHKQLTEQEIYRYEVLRQAGGELNIQYSLREDTVKKEEPKELEIGSDVSPYNTQNLQAVVAEGIQDVLDGKKAENTESVESIEEAIEKDEEAKVPKSMHDENEDLLVTQMYNPVMPEAPVGQELETDEDVYTGENVKYSDTDILGEETKAAAMNILNSPTDEIMLISDDIEEKAKEPEEKPLVAPQVNETVTVDNIPVKLNYFNPNFSDTGVIEAFNIGSNMDSMLSQGYDGQISLVMPNNESEYIEKQITGQISIEEVMQEWERKKRANEAKLVADIKAQVKKETKSLLDRFDDATQDTLLAQIENAMISAALQEEKQKAKSVRPKQIKVNDINGSEEKKPVEPEEKEEEKIVSLDDILDNIEKTEENDDVEAAIESKMEELAKEEAKKEDNEDDGIEELLDEPAEIPADILDDISEDEKKTSEEDNKTEDKSDTEKEEIEVDTKDEDAQNDIESEEAESDEDEESEDEAGEDLVNDDLDEEKLAPERELTEQERQIFSAFVRKRNTEKQLAYVLDNITLASCTGNVLVSSEEGDEVTTFSKLLIQEIAQADSNFTGKVAIINGDSLNHKDIAASLEKVKNGAIIISSPEELNKKTTEALIRELEKDGMGIVVILQGRADVLDKMVSKNPGMSELFNLRIDIEAFDHRTLAEYAKSYAYDNEYSIDELGLLALYTRLSDMQTADHEVTLSEIEEIVDEAIYYADRKTPSHFFDILFGKRYDKEDMIILREKDFMHY